MDSVAYKKAFNFAVEIIKLDKYLREEKKEYILSRQILRSGTSIGANIKEGFYAQSKKDFLSKISIALKEASETEYWLELLCETNYLNKNEVNNLIRECTQLIKILTTTVKTTKKNLETDTK